MIQVFRKIILLGKYGGLSKGLNTIFKKNNPDFFLKKISDKTQIKVIKIATYSATLKNDNLENFQLEIKYYENLIKNLKKDEHLIFISSMTLEATNITYYSKAKKTIEELIENKLENYTILRLGMIFDINQKKFTLASMDNSSNSIFTFANDIPKTTACTIKDIYKAITRISSNLHMFSGKTINIGLSRFSFNQLQNISKYRKYRIPILSFFILRLISKFSPRLKAYVGGSASSDIPNIGFKSSFDS